MEMCTYMYMYLPVLTGDYIFFSRSFNIDKWKQKLQKWKKQRKLDVTNWFRKFDSNSDGELTRKEFIKGLKASGIYIHTYILIAWSKVFPLFDLVVFCGFP